MNKRGVEEAGPVPGLSTLMWIILSVTVLFFLILIFTQFFR